MKTPRARHGPAPSMRCPCSAARNDGRTAASTDASTGADTDATPYALCCGPHHQALAETGRLTAPTAEALMRSRYSAFVLDLRPYLLASWHPSTRPAALAAPEPGLTWLGLTVTAHREAGNTATVAFVARSKLGGRAHRLVETSRFVREDGQWFYVDGDLA